MGDFEGGTVLTTDDRGYILKRASCGRIQAQWWPPLTEIIGAYAERMGPRLRSVYVRGSVPLGQAAEFISDIDTFAIVDCDKDETDLEWAEPLQMEIRRKYPFVASIELRAFTSPALPARRTLAATVATQSACVFGVDDTPCLPRFRPGIDMVLHAWDLPKDLALAKRVLGGVRDPGARRRCCLWGMKRVVRSGFELVMERAACYTRDLGPCCRIFARYYPEKFDLMAEALELAINSDGQPEPFGRVGDQLGQWIHQEMCLRYGAARISQMLAAGTCSAQP